jgi:hypothetical protein
VVPDSTLSVGDVHGRPIAVAESAPDPVIAVERDRILDPQVLRGLADVVDVLFERELGRVDADHHKPLVCVLLEPGADIAERAEPVDAGVGPEVDEDDLSAQVVGHGRLRVEPAGRSLEAWKVCLSEPEEAHVRPTAATASRITSATA